jgi:hypothetical protein
MILTLPKLTISKEFLSLVLIDSTQTHILKLYTVSLLFSIQGAKICRSESNGMKDKIKISVRGMMEDISVTATVEYPNCFPSALDFIYEAADPSNDGTSEYQVYLSET